MPSTNRNAPYVRIVKWATIWCKHHVSHHQRPEKVICLGAKILTKFGNFEVKNSSFFLFQPIFTINFKRYPHNISTFISCYTVFLGTFIATYYMNCVKTFRTYTIPLSSIKSFRFMHCMHLSNYEIELCANSSLYC